MLTLREAASIPLISLLLLGGSKSSGSNKQRSRRTRLSCFPSPNASPIGSAANHHGRSCDLPLLSSYSLWDPASGWTFTNRGSARGCDASPSYGSPSFSAFGSAVLRPCSCVRPFVFSVDSSVNGDAGSSVAVGKPFAEPSVSPDCDSRGKVSSWFSWWRPCSLSPEWKAATNQSNHEQKECEPIEVVDEDNQWPPSSSSATTES